MLTSAAELLALQRAAELEAPLQALEDRLAALGTALANHDALDIETRASELHRALATAIGHFSHAARHGGVPASLRQRLSLASARVATQREALARATAALDRAIEVLMPSAPDSSIYGANGAADRAAGSGYVCA